MNERHFGTLPEYDRALDHLSQLVRALTTIGFDANSELRDYAGKETMRLIHDISQRRLGYEEGYAAAQEERLIQYNQVPSGMEICVSCDELFPQDEFEVSHKEHHEIALKLLSEEVRTMKQSLDHSWTEIEVKGG